MQLRERVEKPGSMRTEATYENRKPIEKLLLKSRSARRENRLLQAQKTARMAVDAAEKIEDPEIWKRSINQLAQIERDLDRDDTAVDLYNRIIQLSHKLGQKAIKAHAFRHIADIHLDNRLFKVAEIFYRHALNIYRKEPGISRLDLANTLRGLALLKTRLNQTEAVAIWKKARRMYASAGINTGVDECDNWLDKIRNRSKHKPITDCSKRDT